ncbi:hypothetical protein AAVH_13354 [Aphelenchoides avenae]|nr:hypothetical protein AAVH_13354 [Aphelenchus avenae]
MRCLSAFFAFSAAFLLTTNAAFDFPLAIGGYGKAFFNASVPLANQKIWVEVDAGHGWYNATFANATEVRVDSKGNYELEAIVGDARRRISTKRIRLYLESHIDGILCWLRKVDLEYMYLYQPGRKQSRQFRYDVMLFGTDTDGEATRPQPGDTADECFHRRLAVEVFGRIMCNASVPMVSATVTVVANRTGPRPAPVYAGRTDNNGDYRATPVVGFVATRSEMHDMVLVFENTCDDPVGQWDHSPVFVD